MGRLYTKCNNSTYGGEPIRKKPRGDKKELGPIILAHGVLGFDRVLFIHYFNGVVKHLRNHGYEVYATKVSRSGSISKRAEELKAALFSIPELTDRLNLLMDLDRSSSSHSPKYEEAEIPRKIHIIAHSMGGFDSRYMITHLGMAPCVETLTTISTPHNEDPIIDLLHSTMGDNVKIIKRLKKLYTNLEAFQDLTTESLKEFNRMTPNVPEVRYYSYAGAKDYIHRREVFYTSFKYLSENFGPNDGLVTIRGAKWGKFLGTIDADHNEEVGWGNFLNIPENLRVPEKLRELSIDFVRRFNDGYFDHLGFYLERAENLYRLGYPGEIGSLE